MSSQRKNLAWYNIQCLTRNVMSIGIRENSIDWKALYEEFEDEMAKIINIQSQA